ncbi:DUF4179 domain-containing protein [Paenibacillus humicola]|uniref:DUF4179 domain-containing protein n=1 Tax=Paenibacillus humicola TaxID=3110540 RepID=UPI00237BBB4F|nr:DUF4179 domain-containing protein [Paenibacillus humicola]
MSAYFDKKMKEFFEDQSAELPEVVRKRIDQTLASLPTIFPDKNGLYKPKRRSKGWRLAIGTASLFILLGITALFSVPSFAEMLRSLFTHNNADIGLLRAQELGFVQYPNIKVKDKGYTVQINEAVADPTRVVMALQLYGPDGNAAKELLQLKKCPSKKLLLNFTTPEDPI